MAKRSGMSISMKQLAENLGFSTGTVSLVLSGKGEDMRISRATQEAILGEAEKYGFQREKKHIRRDGKRYTVYFFCPFSQSTKVVNGRSVYGLHQAILEENLPVDIVIQPYYVGKLEKRKMLFSNQYCDGIIISGLFEGDMNFLLHNSFDVPIVLFNRPNERYSSVYVDNYEAGKKVSYVFAKRGWRNVGLLQAYQKSKAATLLMMGFLDGCEEYGIAVKPENILETHSDMAGGQAVGQKMLNEGLPEALFIINPGALTGFLSVMSKHHIKVPGQLEIITYGDENLGKELYPSQTMLHMPIESIMSACLKMLLRKICSLEEDHMPTMQVVPVHFSFQDSCPEVEGI